MAYHLNKSAVITGCVNSFCLTCDVFLTSQTDADAHVTTTSHRSALDKAAFVDKFKDEHIWKFKWGYFCEFCNILLPIAAKVTVHITDENHKLNKLNLLAKNKGNGVTFNNVFIEETSWHGLSEDICYICNVESNDQKEHKNDAKHCLNLVLKPVKSDENNAIYREIDGAAIQCLTCNILLSPDSKNAHLNSEEHQKAYAKCLINAANTDVSNAKQNKDKVVKPDFCKSGPTNANNNHSLATANKKTKILDSISKYQRDSIQVNLERDTAYCKKCLIVIDFDPDVIEDHIKEHSTPREVQSDLKYPALDKDLNKINIKDLKPEVNSNKSDDDNVASTDTSSQTFVFSDTSEIADMAESIDGDNASNSTSSPLNEHLDIDSSDIVEFAKANNITYNKGNTTAFCRTCEVKVPSYISSMKEHVRGAPHQKKLEKLGGKNCEKKVNCITKKKMSEFINSKYTIEIFNDEYDIVINLKYCIREDSFHMVRQNGFKKRCLVCSTDLQAYENVREHSQKYTHLTATDKITVITSVESEFVREIKPDIYHCGFCNLIVASWRDMENHLICSQHKQAKFSNNYRLREHIPKIHEHRAERQMEAFVLFHLMHNMGRPRGFRF